MLLRLFNPPRAIQPIWRSSGLEISRRVQVGGRLSRAFSGTGPRSQTTQSTNRAPAGTVVKGGHVFTQEELQVARDARLKGLEPYVSRLPAAVIPYAELMRLEKPIGSWLLYSPCTWGITMAAYSVAAPLPQTLSMLAIFGVGAVVMRGAGCTINDILDRNLDNQVARTIERPIASGRVSTGQAYAFLTGQLAVGLAVLLSLPLDCFLLGASSLALVFTYPLFKRFTYYPQAVLSACFNWGALLGFPAMGVWNWPVMLPLYASSYLWCMTYDTIYAHQDKRFDVKAGIKSTALAWGDRTKPICYAMTAAQMACFATAGYLNAMGPGFAVAAVVGGARIFNMIRKVDLDDPANCWYWFKDNINTGHVFFLGMFADYLLKLFGFL